MKINLKVMSLVVGTLILLGGCSSKPVKINTRRNLQALQPKMFSAYENILDQVEILEGNYLSWEQKVSKKNRKDPAYKSVFKIYKKAKPKLEALEADFESFKNEVQNALKKKFVGIKKFQSIQAEFSRLNSVHLQVSFSFATIGRSTHNLDLLKMKARTDKLREKMMKRKRR